MASRIFKYCLKFGKNMQRGWGADVPLFETIKTNAGTQPTLVEIFKVSNAKMLG